MNKSTAANIAQQARRSAAAGRRGKKDREIRRDPSHRHDWRDLPPLPDLPPQRRCKTCQAIETYGPDGWL